MEVFMKKRITLALVAVMVLSLVAGCGKKDSKFTPYDYSDYVTLGEYTNLDIEVDSAEVTEKQMEEFRQSVIDAMTTQEHVTDRVVGEKDKIHLQFTGYLDGEAFEGGSTGEKGTDYTIGGGYIDDLNKQLIGLECGKEYSLNCTFPKDYGKDELNGKDVVFVVTVDYIFGDDIVPEYTDELVKEYSEKKFTTIEDFEKDARETLAEQNLSEQDQKWKAALISTIIENAEIKELPADRLEEIYSDYYDYYKNMYTTYASYFGMTYESLLAADGLTDAKLQEECRKIAESQLQSIVVMTVIGKAENMALSDEEYESEANAFVEAESLSSLADIEENYGKAYVYETLLLERVADFLYENNKMVVTEPKDDTEEEATTGAE